MSLGEWLPVAGLDPPDLFCKVAERWLVDQRLIEKASRAMARLPFRLLIISGWRSKAEQDSLRDSGRPAAPDELSTHRSCPATGADLWPNIAVTDAMKAQFLAEMTREGLRVGGGSPIDPDTGIPVDWNHVDLGPRRS